MLRLVVFNVLDHSADPTAEHLIDGAVNDNVAASILREVEAIEL